MTRTESAKLLLLSFKFSSSLFEAVSVPQLHLPSREKM